MKNNSLTLISTAFILLAAVFTAPAQIQSPVDEEQLLRAIVDSDSPHYYPALMLRYEAGDTTLNLADYRYLYYGYAYQDAYRPLEPVPGETELLTILEQSPYPGPAQAARLLDYAREVMKTDPFSPRNLNFMAYASLILGDSLQAEINSDRLYKVIRTIQSTGTGMKESSPWHVLWFSHATDVVGAMGLEVQKRQVRSRTVEYVQTVRYSKKDPRGYYFDFSRIYWRKPEGPPRQKRVGGFELNGIQLGGGSTTPPSR